MDWNRKLLTIHANMQLLSDISLVMAYMMSHPRRNTKTMKSVSLVSREIKQFYCNEVFIMIRSQIQSVGETEFSIYNISGSNVKVLALCIKIYNDIHAIYFIFQY